VVPAEWTVRGGESATKDDSLRVLTVCRLVPKKGVDLLIRALDAFGRRSARAWTLTIAGEGPERENLLALSRRLDCEARIRWLGAVPNEIVPRLMADADLFALACRVDEHGDRDGIPVVLMEAMAAGVPVLTGDLPAIRELVEDGVTGCCVDAADHDALMSRVDWIATHDREVRAMAQAGRQRVADEFSLAANVANLGQAFEECIHRVDASSSKLADCAAEVPASAQADGPSHSLAAKFGSACE
jgi:glycosyltransferase involved in cell wall biosynthesis